MCILVPTFCPDVANSHTQNITAFKKITPYPFIVCSCIIYFLYSMSNVKINEHNLRNNFVRKLVVLMAAYLHVKKLLQEN